MTALLKSNKDSLMQRGYANLVKSIYDVKTAVFGKHPNKPPEEQGKSDTIEEGQETAELKKETAELAKVARLLLSITKAQLEYERKRFGSLKFGGKSPMHTSAFRRRMKKKKELETDYALNLDKGFRRLIRNMLRNAWKAVWKRLKNGIKRIIGKRGIKLIRKLRAFIRKWKIIGKRAWRTLLRPWRQLRRFIKSLPKKAAKFVWNRAGKPLMNAGKNLAKNLWGKVTGKTLTKTATKQIVKKTAQKTATKGMLQTFKNFYKTAVAPGLKRIALIGALIDFAINYFIFKEPIGQAAVKAIGSGLGALIGMKIGLLVGPTVGATLGSFIPIPGVGTFLGGAAGAKIGVFLGGLAGGFIGEWLGGWLYNMFTGGAKEGAKVKKPQLIMVGEGQEDEYIVPKSRLAWFVAPLLGDMVSEALPKETEQESAELERETADLKGDQPADIEKMLPKEEKKQGLWNNLKSGVTSYLKRTPIGMGMKLFSHIKNKFSKSNTINKGAVHTTMQNLDNFISKYNSPKGDSPDQITPNTAQPTAPKLNNIEPEPEPDLSEVVPPLIEVVGSIPSASTQQPQLLPFPIPVNVGASEEAYAVWGKKIKGN